MFLIKQMLNHEMIEHLLDQIYIPPEKSLTLSPTK